MPNKRNEHLIGKRILVPLLVAAFFVSRITSFAWSARLGNVKEAYQWLEKAIDLAGKKDIRQMALDDPDLERLWLGIA